MGYIIYIEHYLCSEIIFKAHSCFNVIFICQKNNKLLYEFRIENCNMVKAMYPY